MGAMGRGKTRTRVQIAHELAAQARIPLLFIDPKGEFVANGRPAGAFADLPNIGAVEAGTNPVPLDFLPRPDSGQNKIARAAMRLRDTLALCCKSPGDLQKDLLRTAIERVISDGGDRNLETVRDVYERGLRANGKDNDSIVSRLNELTHLSCFDAKFQPGQFFSQSWIVSLKGLPEELKRLVTLVLLDAVSAHLLDQADSASSDTCSCSTKRARCSASVAQNRPSISCARAARKAPWSCSCRKTRAISRARPTTSPRSSARSSPSPAIKRKKASTLCRASSAANCKGANSATPTSRPASPS